MSDDSLMKEGLLKASESASFLGVSRSTIYDLMNDGSLPYVKIKRARRIPKQVLIDYANANLHKDGRFGGLVDLNNDQKKRLRK